MISIGDLPVHRVQRVMSEREADDLVGTYVADTEPTINVSGIWADADTGEPILAYMPMPEAVAELRKAVLNIKYSETVRQTTGVRNRSVTFGMAPRKPYQRRESCRPTALSYQQPAEHAVLVKLASIFADMYREFAPDLARRDVDAIDEVSDEWRLHDAAMWTSGVVNKSSQLPYHRDGFNFATWSAMPVVRRNMTGGYLHVPEFDATVACRDGWVSFFPGYKYVHGVTPMSRTASDGYRYSVVYYALKGMKDCFTHAVETAEAQSRRTAREDDLVKAIKGEIEFKVSPGVTKLGNTRQRKGYAALLSPQPDQEPPE